VGAVVTDRDLRRMGICSRNPAARRLLALTLGDCGVDAVEWLLVRATRDVGPANAAAVATQQLQDGTWREAWAAERRRRAAEEVGEMPRERLEGLVACRVLADRRTVDEVAAEFHLERDEVRRLVIRHGVRRGMTDDLIGQALGLVPARRVELPRRPAASAPASSAPAPAAAPAPTRAQIGQLYLQAGRRPPAHVLEILTATRKP
jgi:hypothetical protein